jgi:uncharacterized protein YkwD
VALLVGAITAGGAWVSMADRAPMTGTRNPDSPPAGAMVEHGSVLDDSAAAPSSATSTTTTTTTRPAPSTTSAPPATSAPPSIPVAPPTTRPPTTTTSPPPSATESQEQRVVDYVNEARRRVGCNRPVVVDQRLANAAQAHSTDMSNRGYFSHTSPEGETFVDRAREAGYPSPAAENIARGQRSAERVMRDWLESDGHRRNILNCEHRAIGVGLDTDGWYWTQVFGR